MTVDPRQWSLAPPPTRLPAPRPYPPSGVRSRHLQTSLPVEIAFLAAYGLPPDILLKVAAAARSLGVSADAALLGAGFPEDTFYRILARHLRVPYLDEPLRLATGPREGALALAIGVARLEPNRRGLDTVLAPRGSELSLLLAWVQPAQSRRFAIVSPRCLAALVRLRDRERLLVGASEGLARWDASLSARAGLWRSQKIVAASVAIYGSAGIAGGWSSAGIAASAAFGLLFSAAVLFNLSALAAAPTPPVPDEAPIPDAVLPVYSVVVPLYGEARIVPDLVDALDALDYPRAKLDIKVMVEANDAATIAALESLDLPAWYQVIVLPPGRPQTKPRALNYALHLARGALLTVYDAEDRPDPRQLRDAVAAFARRRSSVACLQAQLSVDHMTETWLTRMFGLEYAALFDVIKPGLAA